MERYILIFFLSLFTLTSCQVKRGGEVREIAVENLVKSSLLENAFARNINGLNLEILEDALNGEGACQISVLEQPTYIHSYSFNVPLTKAAVRKGEKLLLHFNARSIEAEYTEAGEAKVKFVVSTSSNRKKWMHATFSISRDWKEYYFPFEVKENLRQGDLKLKIQLGFPPQKLVLGQLGLRKYERSIEFDQLPKTQFSYNGIDPDAGWRKAANERIEEFRKGDFKLAFYQQGKQLHNASLELSLKSHHFRWGTTVKARDLVNDPNYLISIARYFNQVTFGNDLKIKHWKKWKEYTEQAFDILEKENIPVKGHVLIWPGFRHLTPYFEEHREEPELLKKEMEDHIDSILSFTKGRVDRWDVTNETFTNQDLQSILGSEEILYSGFRKLAESEPDVHRFVNEYGIISRGGLYFKKQKWYKDYAKRVDENTGGLLDGIGIQCHMGTDLTGIERVYEILDYYADLGKMIGISEFTMTGDDPDIRYKYTRDFMTIAFSHPSVHEFVFWGLNEKDNWKVDIFKNDWKRGSMGKAFEELVQEKWTTNLSGDLNNRGEFEGRGFYGLYKYELQIAGKKYSGSFSHLPGNHKEIKIDL